MLDPRFIRENPEKIKEILEKRFMDVSLINEWLTKDKIYREIKKEIDELRHKKNLINKEIAKLRKEKKEKEIKKLIEKGKLVEKKLKDKEKKIVEMEKELKNLFNKFPNLLDPEVPIGEESKNKEIRRWGETKTIDLHHQDIAEKFNLLDIEQASKVSGARFFYLKNELAILNLGLQKFALDKLMGKGFKPIIPPFMLRKKPYERVTSFDVFEDAIYKIEKEDLYLIATSEHPLACLHMNQILKEKDLPLKYVGISPCFRKEAGAHGKDTKGIFRVHQFFKIEQFIFCKSDESEELHKELVKNAEEILRALEIPYRIVLLASGETPQVSAKTYDLEGWFPYQKTYREIGSASNCLDFQSRRLGIRYYKNGQRIWVHTLNATGLAIERVLACLIENKWRDKYIEIPKTLWKYVGIKKIQIQ